MNRIRLRVLAVCFMQPTNPIPPKPACELLTKREAAEYLTIATRTLDDWRKATAIAAIERPGFVRFLRSDLDDFITRHRIAAKAVTKFRPRRKKAENSTTREAQQP